MPHSQPIRYSNKKKKPVIPVGVTIQTWAKGKLSRYAICPTHASRTSKEQGVGETDEGRRYVLFRCGETPLHSTHVFAADWPVGAPEKPADIEKWVKAQIQSEMETGQ